MVEWQPPPEDLWPEILSNLPVKPLLRFRSVSKSWRALIDDPNFAYFHLTRFNDNNPNELLVQVRIGDKHSLVRCSEILAITETLGSLHSPTMSIGSFPALSFVKDWDVLSCVNGITLLRSHDPALTRQLILWNPSIRKARAVPPSPVIPYGMKNSDLGLGFDPSTKDYKHVRLLGNGTWSHLHYIAIYSVKTNSWKKIRLRGKGPSDWLWRRSICSINPLHTVSFRGVLYHIRWTPSLSLSDMVAFDFSTEVFSAIELPAEVDFNSIDPNEKALALADAGSSLALCCVLGTKGSLWVFGPHTDSMCWTKRYTFSSGYTNLGGWFKFLYLANNEDMFVNWTRTDTVTSCNLKTLEEKLVLETDV